MFNQKYNQFVRPSDSLDISWVPRVVTKGLVQRQFFLNEPVSKQGIAKKFIVLLIELAYIYKLLVNHRQIIDHFEMKKVPN